MDNILHEYTAGELLQWLEGKVIDDYIDTIIEEDDGESYPLSILDIDALKIDFIREIRRYEVIKRGYTLYLHDNKVCEDLLSWSFTDDNYEEIQNIANDACESLNNRTMRFISRKERCW